MTNSTPPSATDSMELNSVYNESCLDTMSRMPDGFVDLILTDPPYGITPNHWDTTVDFMDEALRVARVVVLTAAQPYSSELVVRFGKYFKYEWIWHKPAATGFLNAKKRPLRAHEQILVFSKGVVTYHPQKTSGHKPVNSYTKHASDGSNYGATKTDISGGGSTERYPRTVITFKSDKQRSALHPTQKPLALFEYLVETYTSEGDVVYDPFNGSGTTSVACQNLNRDYVGSETSKEYCGIAHARLDAQPIRENTKRQADQYKCQSYFDDSNILQDCTCGKCR